MGSSHTWQLSFQSPPEGELSLCLERPPEALCCPFAPWAAQVGNKGPQQDLSFTQKGIEVSPAIEPSSHLTTAAITSPLGATGKPIVNQVPGCRIHPPQAPEPSVAGRGQPCP